MKMILLNGSPKGHREGSNTKIFIDQFLSGMQTKCEVKSITKESPEKLAEYMGGFDVILMVMPLYIHVMPSRVMELIEHMDAEYFKGKKLGFIVQCGFPESIHGKYLADYFEVLAKRLQCGYLGTVIKGDAAFIYKNLNLYAKTFELIKELGSAFERTGQFNEQIVMQLAQPYRFGHSILCVMGILSKLGIFDKEWKKILRENGALGHAADRPFLKK